MVVKVPARIKHIYHHHTKNLHIHKVKPKPEHYKSYAPPRSRAPPPYSGNKKRNQPWRDEKTYDDDYGFDEYDYGGYGNGGWGSDKNRYKEERGRYKDDFSGYDYQVPKRGRWREESKRAKGYSSYAKRSSQWHPKRSVNKKVYGDVYEGVGTSVWPEVKEHDSWHRPRPQGFQPNARVIPTEQYHDTSIHPVEFEKRPSEFQPSVIPPASYGFDRQPSYERQLSYDRSVYTEDRPQLFDGPSEEPMLHSDPQDYQPQESSYHPVTAEAADTIDPTGPYPLSQNYDRSQNYPDSQYFESHHLQ